MNKYSIITKKDERGCDWCGEQKQGIEKYTQVISKQWKHVYICPDCRPILIATERDIRKKRTRDEWLKEKAK